MSGQDKRARHDRPRQRFGWRGRLGARTGGARPGHPHQATPYVTTALGASEVTFVELANAYRLMASGVHAEPHWTCRSVNASDFGLPMIQEGLRGVVRIPGGATRMHSTRTPNRLHQCVPSCTDAQFSMR